MTFNWRRGVVAWIAAALFLVVVVSRHVESHTSWPMLALGYVGVAMWLVVGWRDATKPPVAATGSKGGDDAAA